MQLLSSFFGNNSWTESEVHRLGMLGNILIQVEVDTFMRDGVPVELETLSIYEFQGRQALARVEILPDREKPVLIHIVNKHFFVTPFTQTGRKC